VNAASDSRRAAKKTRHTGRVYSERLDIRLSGVELEALDDLARVWRSNRSQILRTLIVATWWQQWTEQEPGQPSLAQLLASDE
jgi:hypothetical protein